MLKIELKYDGEINKGEKIIFIIIFYLYHTIQNNTKNMKVTAQI